MSNESLESRIKECSQSHKLFTFNKLCDYSSTVLAYNSGAADDAPAEPAEMLLAGHTLSGLSHVTYLPSPHRYTAQSGRKAQRSNGCSQFRVAATSSSS